MPYAEYIWLDSQDSEFPLRSMSQQASFRDPNPSLYHFAGVLLEKRETSGRITVGDMLVPTRLYRDPFRDGDHYLLLCDKIDTTRGKSRLHGGLRPDLEWRFFTSDWSLEVNFIMEFLLAMPDVHAFADELGVPAAADAAARFQAFQTKLSEATATIGLSCRVRLTDTETGRGMIELAPGSDAPKRCKALWAADDLNLVRWLARQIADHLGMTVSLMSSRGCKDRLTSIFSNRNMRSLSDGMRAIDTAFWGQERIEAQYRDDLKPPADTALSPEVRPPCCFSGRENIQVPLTVRELDHGHIEYFVPCATADPYAVVERILDALEAADEAFNIGKSGTEMRLTTACV